MDAGLQLEAADGRKQTDACATDDAGDQAPDSGAPAVELCDGSEHIRLTFVHLDEIAAITRQFFFVYGKSFLAIDGRCRFYVLDDYRRGNVTGTLSHADGEQLGRDLRFTQLRSWPGQHIGGSATRTIACGDSPVPVLTTAVSHMRCSCTCPDDAPPGVGDAAVDAALQWVQTLLAAGSPLTDPVIAVALPASTTGMPVVTPWPLSRALTSIPDLLVEGAQDPRYTNGPYARIEDPVEVEELRALRRGVRAIPEATGRYLPARVSEGNVMYDVYIRDEWPQELRDRLAAFHPQFAELPVE